MPADAIAFDKVPRARISDKVADQIQKKILQGDFLPGDKLPPERRLAEMLGVTRTSLREGLKRLEDRGLLEIRQGNGAYVQDYTQRAGIELLESLIRNQEEDLPRFLRSVHEFREILQPEIVGLAAKRRTEEHLREMREVMQKGRTEDEPDAFCRLDLDFFLCMSRASGNLLFPLLLNSVREVHQDWGRLFFSLPGTIETVRRFHSLLARAIKRRDAKRAASVMRKLLEYGNPILLEGLGDKFSARGSGFMP